MRADFDVKGEGQDYWVWWRIENLSAIGQHANPNMGAELGHDNGSFQVTRNLGVFLKSQGRENVWIGNHLLMNGVPYDLEAWR